jgi:DNA transformation protein
LRAWVEDQLGRVVKLRSRPMFGGVGFYADDLFFGFLDRQGMLYFKVDDASRPLYESHGMEPFLAPGETMSTYYRVPEGLLEDPDELSRKIQGAVGAARRAKRR